MAPRKDFPDLQFTVKKSVLPAGGRRTGRIFSGELSAEGDFSGGDPIIGHRRDPRHVTYAARMQPTPLIGVPYDVFRNIVIVDVTKPEHIIRSFSIACDLPACVSPETLTVNSLNL